MTFNKSKFSTAAQVRDKVNHPSSQFLLGTETRPLPGRGDTHCTRKVLLPGAHRQHQFHDSLLHCPCHKGPHAHSSMASALQVCIEGDTISNKSTPVYNLWPPFLLTPRLCLSSVPFWPCASAGYGYQSPARYVFVSP